MSKKVHARFANGVFTPLEPVAFLGRHTRRAQHRSRPIQEPPTPDSDGHFIPHNGRFLPGMEDPQKIKQLLMQEDVEHYVNSAQQGGSI